MAALELRSSRGSCTSGVLKESETLWESSDAASLALPLQLTYEAAILDWAGQSLYGILLSLRGRSRKIHEHQGFS